MSNLKKNGASIWLGITTGLLVVIQLCSPSIALAATGLAGTCLLVLSLQDNGKPFKKLEKPKEQVKEPPRKTKTESEYRKRDLEEP